MTAGASALAAVFLTAANTESGASLPSPAVLDLAVCQAVREQQDIEHRWPIYEHRREEVTEQIEQERVVGREAVTRFIHRSRPDGIPINERILEDGRPVAAAEAARQEAKVESRRAELARPRPRAQALAAEARGRAARASTMAAMTEAFHIRLEGSDWIEDEPCWVIAFAPRAGYRPRTREQEVFGKMQGVAWVRMSSPAFLRIEAEFIDSASLKLGPLATISKGSRFLLEQADVAPGVPMPRRLTLDLDLRLFLLVHRRERRITSYSDFDPVNPPWPLPEP